MTYDEFLIRKAQEDRFFSAEMISSSPRYHHSFEVPTSAEIEELQKKGLDPERLIDPAFRNGEYTPGT